MATATNASAVTQSTDRVAGKVTEVGDLVRRPGGKYSIEFSLATPDGVKRFVAEDYVALGVEGILYIKEQAEVEIDLSGSEDGQPSRVTYVKNVTTDEEVSAADASQAI